MKYEFKKIEPSQKWIIDDSNPIIREKSTDLDINNITSNDIEAISKLISYTDASFEQKAKKYNIQPGIAITGVQIGYMKRVCYIHFMDVNDEKTEEHNLLLINPEIIENSYQKSYLDGGEGCLSVPNARNGIVPRYSKIKIKYYDIYTQQYRTLSASGMLAICIQHEMDHMDGKLYYDRINIFNPFYVDESWEKIK
ncbi:MAG: peptide deformylase [Ureaplasma sp.]|nr:peptide deformylase [Ureaplasma sp.]